MKILADQYLYHIRDFIPGNAVLELYQPDDGFPAHAVEYDAMLIRTVTKINRQTLSEAGRLRFIGSATAGFDHVDREHLRQLGIAFAHSAGCNANAVGEYIITVLTRWAEKRNINLQNKKVGVVGCGHTGSSVLGYLQKLGVHAVPFDPPREERDPGFRSAGREELLSCDILTFHTPLSRSGRHPTFHLCSNEWLARGFDLVINAARGGVVDEKALLHFHANGHIRDFILDVWEGEPVFSDESAENAFIATPHIAGYSREAKWRASEMVAKQMCEFFGIRAPSAGMPDRYNPDDLVSDENLSFAGFLWKNHKIDLYDRELRKLTGLEDPRKSAGFARLRSETETRFEFGTIIRSIGSTISLPRECTVFSGE